MKEINLGGIFISPIAADLAIALLIFYLLRRFLLRGNIEGRVWHPQLFNLCIYLVILSILALLN
jgi:hypothetical protein